MARALQSGLTEPGAKRRADAPPPLGTGPLHKPTQRRLRLGRRASDGAVARLTRSPTPVLKFADELCNKAPHRSLVPF